MPFFPENNGVLPMKSILWLTVGMGWIWTQIAWTVEVNGLAKSHQQKVNLKEKLGSNAQLRFHTHDVYTTSAVLVTVNALLALIFSVIVLEFLIPSARRHAIKFMRFNACVIFFLIAWLFATLVPFTYYLTRRSADITVFINGAEAPQDVIDQVEKDLNTHFRYRELGYWKICAILPWITLLFTFIAAVVMCIAPGRADDTFIGPVSSRATETTAVGHGVTTQPKPAKPANTSTA